ncbi:unnamed protein product [Periconia digitata]|uniref:Uncharacterized protein n=1 Tax=Periconia digitata TaxID=1303443 RepID=A0A9W4XXA7_9PLEO|nr:unnamed protein product [Periconia digitata]
MGDYIEDFDEVGSRMSIDDMPNDDMAIDDSVSPAVESQTHTASRSNRNLNESLEVRMSGDSETDTKKDSTIRMTSEASDYLNKLWKRRLYWDFCEVDDAQIEYSITGSCRSPETAEFSMRAIVQKLKAGVDPRDIVYLTPHEDQLELMYELREDAMEEASNLEDGDTENYDPEYATLSEKLEDVFMSTLEEYYFMGEGHLVADILADGAYFFDEVQFLKIMLCKYASVQVVLGHKSFKDCNKMIHPFLGLLGDLEEEPDIESVDCEICRKEREAMDEEILAMEEDYGS